MLETFPFLLGDLRRGRFKALGRVRAHLRRMEVVVGPPTSWLLGDTGLRGWVNLCSVNIVAWLLGRFSDNRRVSFLQRVAVLSGYCVRMAE